MAARLKALRLAGRLTPMSRTYPSRSTVTGSVTVAPRRSAGNGQSDYTDLPARHDTQHSDPACSLLQLEAIQLIARSAKPQDTLKIDRRPLVPNRGRLVEPDLTSTIVEVSFCSHMSLRHGESGEKG